MKLLLSTQHSLFKDYALVNVRIYLDAKGPKYLIPEMPYTAERQ